tara:strand:- start:2892 stop:3050 length:159 start_codon:yes stop_codon:yes gene_type:complete
MSENEKEAIWVSQETHQLFKEWCSKTGRKLGATADILIKTGIVTLETEGVHD